VQRAGRSGRDRRVRGAGHPRFAGDGQAALRHLPRPPAPGAGPRRQDAQDGDRPSRRQPSGQGPRHRQGRDHQPEPRLLRAAGVAAEIRRGDACVAVRRQQRGAEAQGQAGLLGAIPSRGQPRPAGQPLSLRSLHRDDGARLTAMPKRTDIKNLLIIGAGPIVIGQACEFDYSGAQACKALREEGYRIILVNSNPATIMTDPGLADATYVEPITPDIVERIIEKERPDALLPTMGGQTALNTAMALGRSGALKRWNVELIGAKEDAIAKAEDRQLFREAMDRIGLTSPKSKLVRSLDEAVAA